MLQTGQMFTKLNLNDVNLADSDVLHIVKMYKSSLRELRLCSRDLTQVAYAAIAECAKLQHLFLLMARGFEDSHLRDIVQNVPDLETLDLRSCGGLTDECLANIHVLRRLRRLSLARCYRISGDALRGLGTIASLQHLNFGSTFISAAVLRSLVSLKDLRSLELGKVDPVGIDIICENFERLEQLNLHFIGMLTDADGVKFCRLQHLKSFAFHGGIRFTDLTFEKGVGSPEMERLSLEGCSLTDAGLARVAEHHGNLRKLRLSHCAKITDEGLIALLRRQPFLEELSLKLCNSLNGACLRELESLCPRLRVLTIYDLPVSASDVDRFQAQRPCVGVFHRWEDRRPLYLRG